MIPAYVLPDKIKWQEVYANVEQGYLLDCGLVFGGRQTLLPIAKQLGWGHKPQEEIGHTAHG